MNEGWAFALGAAISGGSAGLSQVIAFRSARVERAFSAREARYADRRSAAATFLAQARELARRAQDFEDQHGVAAGQTMDAPYTSQEYQEAYFLLRMLAPELTAAANQLDQAVIETINGTNGAALAMAAATTDYLRVATALLAPNS